MKTVLALCIAAAGAAHAQTASLNLSHDLTTLQIGAQNMTPDTPDLDSRPLLEAAVAYAQAHSIPLITCDPGAYYFLTGHPFGRFFSFQNLHDLTFDLAGSDLYFQLGNWIGLECDGCQNVQFLNFTLDSLQLPFTQVQVTSVDTAAHRIYYAPVSGWEPATDFNTVRNPLGVAEPLYAFDFRNGAPVRSTGRMAVTRPIDPAFLLAPGDGTTWSDPKQLASIQPGDIIALTARAGGPTLVVRDGSNNVIKNVSVYFSGGVGVQVTGTSNTTVEQVQVMPRPGTDRLVGSNADGISAVQLGQNLTIERCRVKRSGDDGMSPNSQELAIVTSQPATRQVTVNRSAYSTFPNGLAVQFIDNKTGTPTVTAHIVSQDPAYSTATPVFGGAATITFDQDIPTLAKNDPMVYADPSFRGSGLLIQNNLVEEGLHARGMSLWGLMGGTIQGNVIRNTPWGGIEALESLSTQSWMTGPLGNMTIQRNTIEQFTTAFGSAVVNAFGGIEVNANDLNFGLISSGSPFQNITVANNFVSTGPYSGLRVQDVTGGSLTGNLLMNVSLQPTANNPSAAFVSQLGQPVVSVSNVNVSSTANTTDSTTAPALVTSGVSFSNDAVAPDSWAAVKGTSLAPKSDIATASPLPVAFDGVAVTITDSTGANSAAPVWFISPSQINFLIPSSCSSGAAVVTVTSNGVVTGRGAILIDSLAPALFSADGSGTGTALGQAVLSHANSQTVTPLTQAVQLGQPGDTASLVLYATGLRNRDSLNAVAVYVGGRRLPVQYAGAQPAYAGLDQVNVALPSDLKGAGLVSLRVVVDGISSNTVQVTFK